MRGQENRRAAFMHKVLQQLKRALGVCGVKVASRFVGQNHARIVCECTRNSYSLLFAAGKMTAGPSQLVAQADPVKQLGSAIAHLRIRELAKFTHGYHDIFLRGEVLHQEMELKDEADELVALLRKLVIAQVGHCFGFDRNTSHVRRTQQGEGVEQRTVAAALRTDYGVNASSLDRERYAAQGVPAFFFLSEVAFNPVAT